MMKRIPAFARAAGRAGLAVAVATMLIAGGRVGLHAAPAGRVLAGKVTVTVNYKGSGTVDAGHQVWVWLFDTPDIGPGSMPVAEAAVAKNGETATFDVGTDRVWVAVAYDEKGVMTGNSPPPSGSPIGIFASDTGAPAAVTPGAQGAVTLTFDDSQRMP